MRLLNIAIFIIFFIFYLLNELILKSLNNIFFTGYYNDILAPILLLSYSNFLLLKYNKYFIGAKSFIFIVICSFIWEFFAPLIKSDAIMDFLDFIAYLTGCFIYNIIFIFYIRKKLRKIVKKRNSKLK